MTKKWTDKDTVMRLQTCDSSSVGALSMPCSTLTEAEGRLCKIGVERLSSELDTQVTVTAAIYGHDARPIGSFTIPAGKPFSRQTSGDPKQAAPEVSFVPTQPFLVKAHEQIGFAFSSSSKLMSVNASVFVELEAIK